MATTTDIGGIFGNKTNNETLYVRGQTASNVQTKIRELNMCETMYGIDSGVGIAVTLTTGLAKATDNVNSGVDSNEIIVENTGAQQAADMYLTQVHKAAKIGLGLATEVRMGLKGNNEIMKCMSGAKSSTGSPKAKSFKNKKITSKIAPPEWLQKWSKIAAEPPL